jgi:hypothetical protein
MARKEKLVEEKRKRNQRNSIKTRFIFENSVPEGIWAAGKNFSG